MDRMVFIDRSAEEPSPGGIIIIPGESGQKTINGRVINEKISMFYGDCVCINWG